MLRFSVFFFSLALSAGCFGQKYVATQSDVSFFSHATIEDITADNTKSSAIFDSSTGSIAFVIPISEFRFAKALMQEHFNERYLETEKFPKATFQGKLDGYQHSTTGRQNVTAIGKLNIHGVTKDVSIPGTVVKQDNKILMKSKFIIKLVDYKVTIPKLMWQKIAEQVEVSTDFTLDPQ
ncbi:MAG: YceI family protein [Chryseolinea sp.]